MVLSNIYFFLISAYYVIRLKTKQSKKLLYVHTSYSLCTTHRNFSYFQLILLSKLKCQIILCDSIFAIIFFFLKVKVYIMELAGMIHFMKPIQTSEQHHTWIQLKKRPIDTLIKIQYTSYSFIQYSYLLTHTRKNNTIP